MSEPATETSAGTTAGYTVNDVSRIELVGFRRSDHAVGWLANQVLRLASPKYRAMLGGALRYGLASAALDHGHCRQPSDPNPFPRLSLFRSKRRGGRR